MYNRAFLRCHAKDGGLSESNARVVIAGVQSVLLGLLCDDGNRGCCQLGWVSRRESRGSEDSLDIRYRVGLILLLHADSASILRKLAGGGTLAVHDIFASVQDNVCTHDVKMRSILFYIKAKIVGVTDSRIIARPRILLITNRRCTVVRRLSLRNVSRDISVIARKICRHRF